MDRLQLLREPLVRACREVYAGSLVTVAVFGSYARHTATPVSDIDLLVVAAALPPGRGRRLRQLEAVEARTEEARRAMWEGAETPPALSPVVKTRGEVLAGSPLFLDMTEHCEILFDHEGFFVRYLAALAARMRALGTRKRQAKAGYYWDYKPGLRAGEVVEL